MASTQEMIALLNDVLSFDAATSPLTADSLLMGEIPEFDSMTVVSVLESIEQQYQLTIADEDISAEAFESVQSLTDFVSELQQRA